MSGSWDAMMERLSRAEQQIRELQGETYSAAAREKDEELRRAVQRLGRDTITVGLDAFDIEGAAAAAQAASQPLDATLTALAGAPTAADKLPYFTGTDTVGTTTFTSFARTVLDDADAATARATLGAAGTVATQNIHTNVTASPSTATSLEETLYTTTLSNGLLATNKDRLEILAFGTAAGTVTTKRLRLYFGVTAIFDSGVVAFNGSHFAIRAVVYRTGAATQVAIGTFSGDVALVTVPAQETEPTETLSGGIEVKFTSTVGAGAAANDVIGKGFMVGYGVSA